MRWPQEDHADIGLIPNSDSTEDLRRATASVGAGAPNTGREQATNRRGPFEPST